MVPPRALSRSLRREHALHDELVGAPVPDAEDRARRAGCRSRGSRGRSPAATCRRSSGPAVGRSCAPAAERVQADEGDDQRADQQHEQLQRVGDRAPRAGRRGRCRCRWPRRRSARPIQKSTPISALEDDAAGGDRDRDLGQHVADDRDDGQVPARGRRVAALEELGHGVDAAAQVERARRPSRAAAGSARPAPRTARPRRRSRRRCRPGRRGARSRCSRRTARRRPRTSRRCGRPGSSWPRARRVRAARRVYHQATPKTSAKYRRDDEPVEPGQAVHGILSGVVGSGRRRLRSGPFWPMGPGPVSVKTAPVARERGPPCGAASVSSGWTLSLAACAAGAAAAAVVVFRGDAAGLDPGRTPSCTWPAISRAGAPATRPGR